MKNLLWMKILVLFLALVGLMLMITWEPPRPSKEQLRKDSLMVEAKKLQIY